MLKSLVYSLLMSLLVTSSLYADVASLDANYVDGDANITTKLNNDRTTLTNSVNNIRGVYAGGVQSSGQVKADTLGEENMADDVNPRIRTDEGAVCADYIYTGLLPTTSATLVGSISTGIGYPDGYRIEKTSSTAKVFSASKWTFGYLLTSGSFDYQEVAIGSATPSTLPNSAVIFRASTNATTISDVQDLRKTSCTSGPFDILSDATGESNLDDVFANGRHNRVSGDYGWVQGLQVSYDTATTFKVLRGSAYINGKYRSVSQDITVPTTTDDPTNGTSGIDTGAIAASTRYNIYAVADKDSVKPFSISFTSSDTPNGVTNYRRIGTIKTDASTKFASFDVMTVHEINQKEIIGAWVNYKTEGATVINGSYNIAAMTDNGTGDTTIAFERPFRTSSDYAIVAMHKRTGGTGGYCSPQANSGAILAGSARIVCVDNNGSGAADGEPVMVIATGERP